VASKKEQIEAKRAERLRERANYVPDEKPRERVERDRSREKDRGDKDRGDKDRGEKDRGEKDRGDKDRGEKDRGDRWVKWIVSYHYTPDC
jgi:hypothetical protein